MGRLGFLFNPDGNMPKGEIKSRDVEFDFLGLLTESIGGNDNKSNGAIKLDEDSIYIELRSRFNGKVKDAFEISYDDLNADDIDRVADNKVQLNLEDKTIQLKTLDHDMLSNFETKLKNKLNTGSFVPEEEKIRHVIADIPAEIRKYHDLLKDGIITAEEFEKKKKELLNNWFHIFISDSLFLFTSIFGDTMEIKSIPEIIKEMNYLVKEEKYDEAYQFAKENINLNKDYVEGEYIFKNLLEELLFQITIKKEIKRKYPLMLDYSTLYSNYGDVLLHFNEYENALKSFKLSYNYNPVNVKAIFGLCELYRIEKNWDEFYNLTIQSFKYDYSLDDLSKSFENLSLYYLNESKESNDNENLKLAVYLERLAEYHGGSIDFNEKTAIEFDDDALSEYDQSIDEIKEYLKSKGLPYGPSIEVITICKNLGFQLDEDKKVVPALFYFNIAYDLTNDPAIKDVIDDLNAKVERRLDE